MIQEIPFIASMPFQYIQDISGVLYPQNFLAGEVVYDIDSPCDTLYFVESGELQAQAKVTLVKETVIPIGKTQWQKTTKKTEVLYFIKQINEGGYFGLEELVKYGLKKDKYSHSNGDTKVLSQLRISTISTCKLLYMTSTAFFRIF